MQTIIGNIALNISFLVYLVLYLPQVIHNLRRGSTHGLSFMMHTILVVGYLTDLMYGVGRDMQWQYRIVDIAGLICLGIQHVQIGYYEKINKQYIGVTVLLLSLLMYVLYGITHALPVAIYDHAGVIAWGTGVVYTLPQMWKNYRFASVMGVSTLFVLFDILCSSCDTISAWCLNWDYPSKFGSPMECLLGIFLLVQLYAYKRKNVSVA